MANFLLTNEVLDMLTIFSLLLTFQAISYLKEQNSNIKGVLADPEGSTMGGGEHHDYNIEGVGNDFIAKTMDMSLV